MAGNVTDIAALTVTNTERDTLIAVIAKINELVTAHNATAEDVYTLQHP